MISQKTKYALKAVLMLAREYERKEPILISEIAKEERIPKKFLENILLELRKKGVLRSKKGKGGGYLLARDPSQITFAEVMRIFEGSLSPLPCLSRTSYRRCEECREEAGCGVRIVMKDVRDATEKIVEAATLREVNSHSEVAKLEAMYYI